MKYITVMHGITGDYPCEYKSKQKAEKAAKNIRGLGYDVDVIKIEDKERKKSNA